MNLECPVCHKKKVERTLADGKPNLFFPFCSRRCKMVDLGTWFDGGYRVPQEPDQDNDSGQQE
jgi:uncharacterized protein